jgi:hypothetical protein
MYDYVQIHDSMQGFDPVSQKLNTAVALGRAQNMARTSIQLIIATVIMGVTMATLKTSLVRI